MPSPKSGNSGSAISPVEAGKVLEADKADPGEVAKVKAHQHETKSGKYGTSPVNPHKPPKSKEEKAKKKHWIEIILQNEAGKLIAGEEYQIILANGDVASGTLDEKGKARVEGIEPGQCHVKFPNLEDDQWRKG